MNSLEPKKLALLRISCGKGMSLIKWLTDAEYIRGPSASKKYFLI